MVIDSPDRRGGNEGPSREPWRADLRLLVRDVYHLGFADAAFDVVHAHQLVQHLADPVAALRGVAGSMSRVVLWPFATRTIQP